MCCFLLQDFAQHFDEVYGKSSLWTHAGKPGGTPTTNNACESLNNDFKNSCLDRERYAASTFLADKLTGWVYARSVREGQDDDGWKEAIIDADVWRHGQRLDTTFWPKLGAQILVPSASTRSDLDKQKLSSKAAQQKWLLERAERWLDLNEAPPNKFAKFMAIYNSFYMLTVATVVESSEFIKYICTCPSYMRYRCCKHCVAYGIAQKKITLPQCKDISVIGDVKRRGRPRKAKLGEALCVN